MQDNSFLIEEAYNQEPGVVQHILEYRPSGTRQARAGRETPGRSCSRRSGRSSSQTHQLSYTLPYTFLDEGGRSDNGIEDISLNYRLQVLMESETRPAFAPRLSLILPTGDAETGLAMTPSAISSICR